MKSRTGSCRPRSMGRARLALVVAAIALGVWAAALWAQGQRPPKLIYANYEQSLKAYALPQDEPASSVPLLEGDRGSVYLWQLRTSLALHLHRAHEETVVVMQGDGECRIAGGYRRIRQGDIIVVPAGQPHSVRNLGKGILSGLSIFTPRYDGKDRVEASGEGSAGKQPTRGTGRPRPKPGELAGRRGREL